VSKPDEPSYVYRVRAASYSSLFDKDVAQTEVLNRFLAECDDPTYRRVAKLAILQRIGPAFVDGLPAGMLTPAQERLVSGPVLGVHTDPELGVVVRQPDRITVLGADRVVLSGPVVDGRVEADVIEDETLRRDRSSMRDLLR
jgi:hypothetical protein